MSCRKLEKRSKQRKRAANKFGIVNIYSNAAKDENKLYINSTPVSLSNQVQIEIAIRLTFDIL